MTSNHQQLRYMTQGELDDLALAHTPQVCELVKAARAKGPHSALYAKCLLLRQACDVINERIKVDGGGGTNGGTGEPMLLVGLRQRRAGIENLAKLALRILPRSTGRAFRLVEIALTGEDTNIRELLTGAD